MRNANCVSSAALVAVLKESHVREYRGVTDLPWYLVAVLSYAAMISAIAILGYVADWWGV